MKVKFTIITDYPEYKTFEDFKKDCPKLKSKKAFEEYCNNALMQLLKYDFIKSNETLEIKTKVINE